MTANDLNADWDNFHSEKITASNIANGAVGNNQLGTITGSGKINFSALTVAGQVQGDVIYHNGTNWARLGAGTAGQALITGGAGANPAWGTNGFGAWDAGAPWIKDTDYTASTDGLVVAMGDAADALRIFTPVATMRAYMNIAGGQCLTCPVRKGDTWKVTGGTVTIYWLPLGN
jgi:hypothetical protein